MKNIQTRNTDILSHLRLLLSIPCTPTIADENHRETLHILVASMADDQRIIGNQTTPSTPFKAKPSSISFR